LRKLFIAVSLMIVAAGFMLGGCWSQEEAQEGVETGVGVVNATIEGSQTSAAQAVGGVVTVATGNPLFGYLASLIVGAVPAVISVLKHRKTKKALGAVITGVETAEVDAAAKKAVKESVTVSATNAGAGTTVHAAVMANT